ncbi:hypothetical protein RAC83_000544 [Xylella fastidiosa]|nr:hypothetical protein [Xylella fastidiosa]
MCWYFGVTVASAVIELHGRCYFKCGETILRSVLFLGHHQCMSSACVFSGFLLHRIYRCVFVLALLLVVSVFPALAQPAGVSAATTGDAWIDQQLSDLDIYAKHYPDSFVDELARYIGIPHAEAQTLLKQGWRAADVYFAGAWALITRQPLHAVLQVYQAHLQEGWQAALAILPVAPENTHYRMLRHTLVTSYDHWDRPIVLDALLRRQLGDRAQRLAAARAAAEAAAAAQQSGL